MKQEKKRGIPIEKGEVAFFDAQTGKRENENPKGMVEIDKMALSRDFNWEIEINGGDCPVILVEYSRLRIFAGLHLISGIYEEYISIRHFLSLTHFFPKKSKAWLFMDTENMEVSTLVDDDGGLYDFRDLAPGLDLPPRRTDGLLAILRSRFQTVHQFTEGRGKNVTFNSRTGEISALDDVGEIIFSRTAYPKNNRP